MIQASFTNLIFNADFLNVIVHAQNTKLLPDSAAGLKKLPWIYLKNLSQLSKLENVDESSH